MTTETEQVRTVALMGPAGAADRVGAAAAVGMAAVGTRARLTTCFGRWRG